MATISARYNEKPVSRPMESTSPSRPWTQPRGGAVECARRGGEHPGDRAVVALLALHLLTTDHQSRQHLVAVLQLRHRLSPIVEERTERQQRGRVAAQRLYRAQVC
jgi:hypothetical protein